MSEVILATTRRARWIVSEFVKDAIHDPYPRAEGTINGNGWTCRTCASVSGQAYRHPASADSYCSACGGPLSEIERNTLAILALASLMERAIAKDTTTSTAPSTRGETPRFVGTKEAAEFLGVTTKALYSMVERKQVPCSRIHTRLRFSPSGLVEWVEKHGVQSPPRRRR
jgi:predicted DNA-binding transcriptional regulator AlpA